MKPNIAPLAPTPVAIGKYSALTILPPIPAKKYSNKKSYVPFLFSYE